MKGVKVSEDGTKVRLIIDNLRQYYIHHISVDGVREKDYFYSAVHPSAYYTLNNIPDGAKLAMSEVSTRNSVKEAEAASAKAKAAEAAKAKTAPAKAATKPGETAAAKPAAPKAATYEEVKPLLAKYTCSACHNADKKQVGPAFKDIARKKYTNDMIVKLIYNPNPENWPATLPKCRPCPSAESRCTPHRQLDQHAELILSMKLSPGGGSPTQVFRRFFYRNENIFLNGYTPEGMFLHLYY